MRNLTERGCSAFRSRWFASLLGPALATGVACGSDPSPGGVQPIEDGGPGTGTDGEVTPDGSTPLPGDSGADGPRTGPLPLITEFLASSLGGLADEDGTVSDWIEIHNRDTAPYDLGGHHLTDSKAVATRWTFPAGTVLPAGGYLVVFASAKNRAVAGKPLHTNFSLSSGDACTRKGEYLALTDKAGGVMPPVFSPYPAQTPDVSYGLKSPASLNSTAFFTVPTPGKANDVASVPTERVAFTPSSGTFASGTTESVTLKVPSPTATIRYTTNRSRPIAVAGRAGNFTADATTDEGTLTGHGFVDKDLVRVSGPAPLVNSVDYFVKVLGPDTFKLAIEPGGPAIDLTGGGSFEIRRDAATGTAATNDFFSTPTPHGFFGGDPVQVATTGTLPGGITAGTTYYVVPASPTTFRLSASPALAPVLDITSTGAGTHTVARQPSPLYTTPIPITLSTQIRAQAYEAGHPDGPIVSEMYFAIDAAAQARTSNLPLVVTHSWNTAMPNNNVPVFGQVMVFEPKAPDKVARLTNPPDLVSPCTLERRGSSTGGDPKFSMALEFQDEDGVDKNCGPLGMPANSDWVMHAPYQFDRSMMHNDLIYKLSNEVGRWAPRTRLFEHLHNEQSLPDTIEGAGGAADYFGVYTFMDKITRDRNRIDVENLTIHDNAPPEVQGGYMFKADRLDSGESGIRPLPGQSFGNAGTGGPGPNVLAWVNPREVSIDPFKKVTPAQSDWFRGHLGEAWANLSGPTYLDPVNGYAKYFDVGAMIDHDMLNTMTRNADAFRLSSYWYKPRFGKLTPGSIWDFDRAEGSTDGRDFDYATWAGGFFTYPWYNEMFRDPNFWQAWIDRLEDMRRGPFATAHVHKRIDEFAEQLNPGDGADTPAKRSSARWAASVPRGPGSNTPITNNLFDGTFTGEIAWLKYWWEQRLAFMDSGFTRPVAASVPPGKVASGTTVTLSSPSEARPGVKIYYTTDGKDPRGPTPGPNLTPSAIEYTGPITITAATNLFVRVFDPATPQQPGNGVPIGTGWSAPTILKYTL